MAVMLNLTASCGQPVRRFPLAAPMWVDPDRNALPHEPAEYKSPDYTDGLDKSFLYWLSDFWRFRLSQPATNVNALDEVPNSSWFTNRIGMFDIPPQRAARGACGETPPLDPKGGSWVVKSGKLMGADPGFFIEGPDGYRYLLKFDGVTQPGRTTGADVVGSKLWWLAGYYTPCNEIVYFRPEILVLGEDATALDEFGDKRPMTHDDVEIVLSKALRTKDGLLRASASRFVPGQPLGPYRYESTRADDPNDVIPHEHRRELRAAPVLASWLNHLDLREQNTLSVLVEEEGRRYIRHYKIDWGDSFGTYRPPPALGRRLGYSYVVDFQQIGEDFITLGAIPRPWNQVERSPVEIFGFYGPDHFDPRAWRGIFQTQAFRQRTYRDILWMIRILSRITPAHIRAIVETARFPDPRQTEYLFNTLLQRRQAIFHAYLREYAPLAQFYVVRRTPGSPEQSVCFEDLAIKHQVAQGDTTYYKMRFMGGLHLDQQLGWVQFTPDPAHPSWSCVVLPVGPRRPADLAGPNAPDNDPLRYGVLKIFIYPASAIPPTSSIELHFYDLGPHRGFQLVGIERPPKPVLVDPR